MSLREVSGIIVGVLEIERARAVLVNDVWHSVAIEFGCVGSRNPMD